MALSADEKIFLRKEITLILLTSSAWTII